MRSLRRLLASYLLVVFLACVLVYLGDARDVPIGQWADANEHLLFVAVPLAVLLVVPGHLAIDGGNLWHLLAVFGMAIVEVTLVYAIAMVLRRALFAKSVDPAHRG